MSGFYMQDIAFIREKAESLGMEFVHHREKKQPGSCEVHHEITHF